MLRICNWSVALALAFTSALVSDVCAQSAYDESLNRALGHVGLTQQSARFDTDAMAQWGGDKYLFRRVARLQRNPWVLPATAKTESAEVAAAGGSLFELLGLATRRTNDGVFRGLKENPVNRFRGFVDTASYPLLNAVRALHEEAGPKFQPSQERSLLQEAEKLTPEARDLLATFVHACAEWTAMRNLAFRKIRTAEKGLRKIIPLKDPGVEGIFGSLVGHVGFAEFEATEFVRMSDMLDLVDMPFFYTGALDLVATCDYVKDSLSRLTNLCDGYFLWNTPLGRIVIRGDENYEYESRRKYLLIVDTGGDDTYRTGGATVSYQYNTGVIIDLGGDDTYVPDTSLVVGPGGGVMGVGLVYDLGGNDTYHGGNRALGAGLLGVGGIWDRSGDDEYRGGLMSQGAGFLGVGVLADLSGSDLYNGTHKVQGFGSTRGCGILFDRQGNDRYVAVDSTSSFGSILGPGVDVSLAQGVGFGFRADFLHGHSMAGGIGYLVDAEGDDSYSAGAVAQGAGFWHAMGMLADLGGQDQYTATRVVQGAGAHFSVGLLYDSEGNDRYAASESLAQGAGLNFGQGWLWDRNGNDLYRASGVSLGSATSNGMGIFRDDSGDDSFVVADSRALGHVKKSRPQSTVPGQVKNRPSYSIRNHLLTLGLFLDLDGHDTYPATIPQAANDTIWLGSPKRLYNQKLMALASIRTQALDHSGPAEFTPFALKPQTT